MQEEFELTYLLKELPAGFSAETTAKEILDIYLPQKSDHSFLRIRKRGETYEITKKLPVTKGDSSHQVENTIPLSLEEFTELSQLRGRRIHKIRYYFHEGGIDYEIDVFQSDLLGLIMADVEFTSNENKAKFTQPHWMLADITQEKFAAGGVLCGKNYSDIEPQLSKFNYKKLYL